MSWWSLVPAAIGVVSSVVSKNSADSQNSANQGTNLFNAQNRYATDMNNIKSSLALAKLNADLAAGVGGLKASVIRETSKRNSDMIMATTIYNDSLLENELQLLWESNDLDLVQLHNQRMRERGAMVATQGASGTVIGDGSNADVVSDQMAQESMDALIISRGADIQASRINNQRAQSLYQGTNEAMKVSWEGEMNAVVTEYNTQSAVSGALASAQIQAGANTISAQNQLLSGMSGADATASSNSAKIDNNLMSGLFGAASTFASSYGQSKTATSQYNPVGSGSGSNTAGSTSSSGRTSLLLQ
jgi:hypothetical protein